METERSPRINLEIDLPEASMAARMKALVERLQHEICSALEALDGTGRFQSDQWERAGGGGGLTRVIEGGSVLEKGGVNTSAVHGILPERMSKMLDVPQTRFFATGISLVIHPKSPYVPTVHANFRYFGLGEDLGAPTDQWFGGGADLTPYYPYLEDAKHFHKTWESVCGRHAVASYPDFKKHCDEYFYLKHRKETRGVGGIFFDYMRAAPGQAFEFVRDAGETFLASYLPIARRRKDQPFGEREKIYHEIRRGRYVEFNLLFDRGTKFGIETDGRTESILMSMPPRVRWHYDWTPEPGSVEERAGWFYEPRDWLAIED